MDTLSNLLYVREMKVDLAYLAHEASEIDKYRVETCCVIGKFIYLLLSRKFNFSMIRGSFSVRGIWGLYFSESTSSSTD